MLIGVTGFKLARLVLNLWVEGTQACAYSQFVSRQASQGAQKKIAPAIGGLSL